jgi:hypothetical protein
VKPLGAESSLPGWRSLRGRASGERLAGWLLALGALLGAASGVLTARDGAPATSALPPGVAALVNGRPILADEYTRALAMLAGDRRDPLLQRDQARVLERLIDEELLVEWALAQGALASERSVRDAVTLAMVESVGAESASRAPSEAELRSAFDAVHAGAGTAARAAPFETVRESVEAAVAGRARDLALREYLAELRGRARIGCADGEGP